MATVSLQVLVRDREKILFEGKVSSVSSVNDRGNFDILPKHAHFISLLKEKLILRTLSGEEKEIVVENRVLEVVDDKVRIYVGV